MTCNGEKGIAWGFVMRKLEERGHLDGLGSHGRIKWN
jgi:hypothetical protein